MPRLLLLWAMALPVIQARGDEPLESTSGESWIMAAQKLQQATVTVRIWDDSSRLPAAGAAREVTAYPPNPSPSVTVCSGVCTGEGRVITAALGRSDTRVRLTLPGGKQADAKVQIVDEYSGLALLKTSAPVLVPLTIAEKQPPVGAEVLTAAGWGTEQPIVSRGMVGAVDRRHPGANYPPLLQCDTLTMQTSTGAGLVNRKGQLAGVIVAAEHAQGNRCWTYAVPSSHVERILQTADQQSGDEVVILKRRRPVVGMILDQEENKVVVQHVTSGGPAEKAGMRQGDHLLATDGVAIRSVYQAVLPTLYKQPGDRTIFRVERASNIHDIQVVLGSGLELPPVASDLSADIVQPKMQVARNRQGAIFINRSSPTFREAFSPQLSGVSPLETATAVAEKLKLLEKALGRCQFVIDQQQKQLFDETKRREQQDEMVQSLCGQIEALQKAFHQKAK
jgi:serine protease Do